MANPVMVASVQETPKSLSIIDNVNLQQVQATMQKIAQFQTVVQKTLKKDHDYGIIPGTGNKPTLLKPGAEKILMLMGLTSEYDVIEKVQDYEGGFFAFTVKCTLSRGDVKVTEGMGHANTKEARYARRWVTEKKLPDGADKNSLPKREKEGKYGKYFEYQVGNDDPYTLANTVLKMAKKRAQIDAVLTVASLSEIFTQDLEDSIPDYYPEETQKPAAKPSQSQSKSQTKTVEANSAPATDNQLKKLFAMSKELGLEKETMIAILQERYQKQSSRELTKAEASDLIEYMTKLENGEEEWIPGDAWEPEGGEAHDHTDTADQQ